jgi:hypothetical protein
MHPCTVVLSTSALRIGSKVALVAMLSVVPSIAHARDAAACNDSHDRALVAGDAGRLVEARRLLEQCSAESCSASLREACVGRLAGVEARVASVILSAEDRTGADLVDVAVAMDGREGPRKLDGRAHDVDPGEHTFVFRLANGRKAERRVVFREGEKGKSVPVTFGATTPPVASPEEPAEPASTQLDDAELRALVPRWPGGPSPLRVVGFGAAGVGIAGLAIGAIFGAMASTSLLKPHCDSTKACDPGVVGGARSAATVSTIGFVAGGLLLASGVTLVLLTPKRESYGARLSAAPAVGLNSGGLSLEGAWN